MLINPKYVSLLSIKQVDKLHVSNTNMYQLGLLFQEWSDNRGWGLGGGVQLHSRIHCWTPLEYHIFVYSVYIK